MEQAWLIPVFGFGAFAFLALFRKYLPGQGKHLSVLAIIAAFVAVWPVLYDMLREGLDENVRYYHFPREWFSAGPLKVGWGIIVDPLTVAMLALITFVSVIVQVYSLGYMRHGGADDPRVGWYFAVHSLFSASMLMLVLADNLLLLYVAWELVGLCSYLLIGFWFERRSAAEAAKKAFVTTRIGDVGLLIGVVLLIVEFDTVDIVQIMASLGDPGVNQAVVTASAFLVFFGAMGKSAQFPLHVWLPDAMEGPTPVSALIHAATMVTAGVFLVARLFPLFDAVESAQLAVAAVGLVTALMGAAMALVMTDLKRVLAYSTMSHLGFMMLALGAGGYTAAIFHLLMHGVAKAMLFLSAGSIMHAAHEETDIRKMGGLRHRMPITSAAFTVGALALAGIPPLNAFWSKDEILLAVARDGLNPVFVVLFLVAIVLSALYMGRAVLVVFFGRLKPENQDIHESPRVMAWPLALLAVLAVVTGFIALPIGYDGIGTFLVAPGDKPHAFEVVPVWLVASVVLALGGLALAYALYGDEDTSRVDALRERLARVHDIVANRFYMDHAYQWTIDRVVLWASGKLAWFDRKVVNDVGVNGPGWSAVETGRRLRHHVTGLFADYGIGIVVGVVALGALLWVGGMTA